MILSLERLIENCVCWPDWRKTCSLQPEARAYEAEKQAIQLLLLCVLQWRYLKDRLLGLGFGPDQVSQREG